MIVDEKKDLLHYGVLRRSGRYPWGSGGPEFASNNGFLNYVGELKSKGLSEPDIAKAVGISTTELRAAKSIAKNEQKQADIRMAQNLKDKGMAVTAIGVRMGKNESSVRALLAPGVADKATILTSTSEMLKAQVAEKTYVDIGTGVEHHINVSEGMLKNSVAVLKEQGYEVHTVPVQQLGTVNKTNVKVLAPPGTTWSDVNRNQDSIQQITMSSDDFGRTFRGDLGTLPPKSINPKRVSVKYAEDGGADSDGVMYIRRGVDDVSIGNSSYAQVRVQVGPNHYLKGMAMYKDDLPEGIDIQFNTNKSKTKVKNDLDAMKELLRKEDGSVDTDNPFGANIKRQLTKKDSKGNDKVTSVMNIVNEEGNWSEWSRTLSSQMLSKQQPSLAREQLDKTYKDRLKEYEELSGLTNRAVKKKLLESFGDDASSAAVHLKAAAIPRTHGHHVILPIPSIKPTEVYAPNYRDGERVVLIRHPHGGRFEIPELVVNNNNREAKKLMGKSPRDAIGIHHSVAERLSGADFDGDTVLVIPNNGNKIKTMPALEQLKGFDPRAEYPGYEGMKKMSPKYKQTQMGEVTNLITDMTIKGASTPELARAVKHSMVVIDAEKHGLNYKLSAQQNGIKDLKEKYQGTTRGASATLISRAGSKVRIPEQKPRSQAEGGPIDKDTGKRVFTKTDAGYVDQKGKPVSRTTEVKRLAITDDAFELSSGTRMETVYAEHSNKLKELGNKARKESVNTPRSPYSSSAAKVYKDEVASLTRNLKIAQRNAPLERQAQVIANATYKRKKDDNPDMDDDRKKKVKYQALAAARINTGAKKEKIVITPKEWEAIQAGAISNSKLNDILDNADMATVRKLATPRTKLLMTTSKVNKAKALFDSGATRAEVADALGVSLSTLDEAITQA